MSRDTPTFTATGGFSAPGVVSAAAQGQSLTAFSQRVAQIGQKVFRDAAIQRAQNLGEVAGLQENFKPKPAFTDAQRVFNATALNAHKQLLITDITRHLQQMRFDVQREELQRANPSAMHAANVFHTRSAGYAQQTLANVPEANRGFAFNYLNNEIGRHQAQFQTQELDQDARTVKIDFAASTSARATSNAEMANALPWGVKEPLLTDSINAYQSGVSGLVQAYKQAGIAGTIGSAAAAAGIKKAQRDGRDLLLLSHFKFENTRGRGSQFLAKIIKRNLPDANGFWSAVGRIISRQKMIQGSSAAQVAIVRRDSLEQLRNTGIGDKTSLQFLKTNMSDANFQAYSGEANVNLSIFQHKKIIEKLDPAIQEENLQTLKAKFQGNPEGLRVVEGIKQDLQKDDQARIKDGWTFNRDNPDIAEAQRKRAYDLPLTQSQQDALGVTGQLPLPLDADQKQWLAQTQEGATRDQVQLISSPAQRILAARLNNASNLPAVHAIFAELQKDHPNLPGAVTHIINGLQRKKLLGPGFMYLGRLPLDHENITEINTAFNTPEKVLEDNVGKDKLQALNSALDTYKEPSGGFGDFIRNDLFRGFNPLAQEFSVATVTFGLSPSVASDYTNYRESVAPGSERQVHMASILAGAKRVGLVFMSDGHMSPQDAAAKGLGLLVSDFKYVIVNGQTLRFQKNLNLSGPQIRDHLGKMQKKFIILNSKFDARVETTSARNVKPGVEPGRFKKITFNTLIKPGRWANSGDGTGFDWILANGHTRMLDKKGHSLHISMEDILNNRETPHSQVVQNSTPPPLTDNMNDLLKNVYNQLLPPGVGEP